MRARNRTTAIAALASDNRPISSPLPSLSTLSRPVISFLLFLFLVVLAEPLRQE